MALQDHLEAAVGPECSGMDSNGYALIYLCNIITSKVALILGVIQSSFQFINKVLNDPEPGYLWDYFSSSCFCLSHEIA